MTGIYKITSPNGKIYIVQSFRMKERWASHRCESKRGEFNYPLYLSLKKYGLDSHRFEVIHELPDDVSPEMLTLYEQTYIDQYVECGFDMLNINPAAGSRKGTKHDEATKKKISKAQKPWTAERKAKWIEGLRNRKRGPLSDDVKRKISESRKGKTYPKLSLAMKGRKLPEEWKKNIALGGTGKKDSEQTKANKSKATRLWHQKRKGGGNAL